MGKVQAMASGKDEQIEAEKQSGVSPSQEQPSLEKEKCPNLLDDTLKVTESPSEGLPKSLKEKDTEFLEEDKALLEESKILVDEVALIPPKPHDAISEGEKFAEKCEEKKNADNLKPIETTEEKETKEEKRKAGK